MFEHPKKVNPEAAANRSTAIAIRIDRNLIDEEQVLRHSARATSSRASCTPSYPTWGKTAASP
eukprot:4750842-Heterocapsa_arctica.AAC.1